ETGPLGPRTDSRHAAAPAAARRAIAGIGKADKGDAAPANGAASRERLVRRLPRPHGPDRLRLRELQRDRQVPQDRRGRSHRPLGHFAQWSDVQGPRGTSEDPPGENRTFRSLFGRKDVNLRIRSWTRKLRQACRRRHRCRSPEERLQVFRPRDLDRAKRSLPAPPRKGPRMSRRLSRRTMLKGVGAAVALPGLEAMPRQSWATAAGTAPPTRMAFVYVPNGVNMQHWTPGAEGQLGDLPGVLEPLNALKNDFTIISGLTADKARPHGDGG